MSECYGHEPVMAAQTAELMVTDREGTYLDATLGMGGHARAVLERLGPKGRLIGLDWDPEMAAHARRNLADFGSRVTVIESNFANLDEALKREGIESVSGALFDLGVSSLHFDKPSRGFSIRHDGPLDMRINPSNPLTAAAIINQWPYEQIEHLIRVVGERWSTRISRAIVQKREKKPIETTGELARIIENAVPVRGLKTHPATRTFLAVRVAVNYEFDNLTRGMQKVSSFIKPGGRMGVITFHSLEDRIVKETFRLKIKLGDWNPVTRKPAVPSEEETAANRRARSAKLRVIEKVEEGK
ncbi:MAG: 16S rRNA (cytosine(1402)-N(4))-methyltransferase RsmH [Elusimicrobiales bacterium]|nr:16S rRNA (cytosine(1402)-N(4))-methyltransferase RsmH [Elusimicrobiales bacterium]